MNKWFVSVVVMSSLLLGTLMMSSPDKTEAAVRQNVVKLFSEDGSCSGVRIKYKKSFFVLTAGHCRPLQSGSFIMARGSDGRTESLTVLAESDDSDLLLLSNPRNEGVDLSDSWALNEKVFSMTHGGGKPAYRTDGELLNTELVSIPLFEIKDSKGMKKCSEFSKLTPEFYPSPFGGFLLCSIRSLIVNSTVAVIPGSSGGGVFNKSGDLVAIVSGMGGGFSVLVPLEDIKKFLKTRK